MEIIDKIADKGKNITLSADIDGRIDNVVDRCSEPCPFLSAANVQEIVQSTSIWDTLKAFNHPIHIIQGDHEFTIQASPVKDIAKPPKWDIIISEIGQIDQNRYWYRDPIANSFMSSNNICWVEYDHFNRLITYSDEFKKIFDEDKSSVSEISFLSRVQETYRDKVAQLIEGQGIVSDLEVEIETCEGSSCWFSLSLKPYCYIDGKLAESVVFLKDIQSRKEDELNLKESTAFSKTIAEAIPDIIVVYDTEDMQIVYSSINSLRNDERSRYFRVGTKAEQYYDLIHPDDIEILRTKIEKVVSRKKRGILYSCEIRITSKKYKWRWYKIRMKCLSDDEYSNSKDCSRVLCVLSDIHKEKRREKALLEQGLLLDQSQLASKTGGWQYDIKSGEVKYTNGLLVLFPNISNEEEGLGFFAESISQEYNKTVQSFIDSDQKYNVFDIIIKNTLGEKQWYRCHLKKLRDNLGTTEGLLGSFQDITLLKTQEEELLTNQIQLERMVVEKSSSLITMYKEKNELLRTARHDINNPLTAIILRIEILQEMMRRDGQDSYLNKISEISEAAERIQSILEKFTDKNNSAWRDYRINLDRFEIVDVIKKLLNSKMDEITKKGININIGDGGFQMYSDKFLTEQILENIISNGIKYCYPGDDIKIEFFVMDYECQVWVTDSGPGIPNSELPKLFTDTDEYTNKPTAGEKSNGVGLYFCQKYAKLIGGRISVESTLGKGSRFKVIMPIEYNPYQKSSVS